MTQRDRRILMMLIPVVVLVGYWFLLLAPKRDELATAKTARTEAEQRRDTAIARVQQLEAARQTFASDYAAVVRLGKAIPVSVDAPSLLLQLDQAAKGTDVGLANITFGERVAATPPAAPAADASAAAPAGDAAAGGVAAATGPGQAVEAAGENAAATEAAQSQPGTGDTTQAPPSQTPPATLESVGMTFTFTGSYFQLADFFHRVKRFVFVNDDRIFIRGRLVTLDSVTFAAAQADPASGAPTGGLTANVTGSVYLTPRAEGVTAGATPAGPEATTPAPAANETAKRGGPVTATVRAVP